MTRKIARSSAWERSVEILYPIDLRYVDKSEAFGYIQSWDDIKREDKDIADGELIEPSKEPWRVLLTRCMVYKDKTDIKKFEVGEYKFDVAVYFRKLSGDEKEYVSETVLDHFHNCKVVNCGYCVGSPDFNVYETLTIEYEYRTGMPTKSTSCIGMKKHDLGKVISSRQENVVNFKMPCCCSSCDLYYYWAGAPDDYEEYCKADCSGDITFEGDYAEFEIHSNCPKQALAEAYEIKTPACTHRPDDYPDEDPNIINL